jgi:Zn-dependent protease
MGDLSRFLPSWTNLLIVPGILAGFTVHELAHTLVAYLLGDESQVDRGRITLNPLRHISWFGAVTFILFGFGWARPVRVDPSRFKSRYLGLFLVAVAGAAANLLLAGFMLALTALLASLVAALTAKPWMEVLGLLLHAEAGGSPPIVMWAAAFTIHAVYANLALAFFNLLPIPTLDGFTVLASLIAMLAGRQEQTRDRAAGQRPALPEQRAAHQPRAEHRPADIHFELGAQYHASGNYQDAIARYRQAIANNSAHGPAYVNLGLAHLALDQRTRAIQAFRGATQYAADEKSRTEAWAQLNKLSEYNPALGERPPASDTEGREARLVETGPWTKTQATPNWLAFGVSSVLTIALGTCLYIYLAIGLIRYLGR